MSVPNLQNLSLDAVAAEATKNVFTDAAAALRGMERLLGSLPWLLKLPVTKSIVECIKEADSFPRRLTEEERAPRSSILALLTTAGDGKVCRMRNCKLHCKSVVTLNLLNHCNLHQFYPNDDEKLKEYGGIKSIHVCLGCDDDDKWTWAFQNKTLTSLKIGDVSNDWGRLSCCPHCCFHCFENTSKPPTKLLQDALSYGRLKELILFNIQLPVEDQETITKLKTLQNLGLYNIKTDIELMKQFTCKAVLPNLKMFGCDGKMMLDVFKDPCHQSCIRRLHCMDGGESDEPLRIESSQDLSENLLFALGGNCSKLMEIRRAMDEAAIDPLLPVSFTLLSEPDGSSVKKVVVLLPIAGAILKECAFRKMTLNYLNHIGTLATFVTTAVGYLPNLEHLVLTYDRLTDRELVGILATRHIPIVEINRQGGGEFNEAKRDFGQTKIIDHIYK